MGKPNIQSNTHSLAPYQDSNYMNGGQASKTYK